MPTLQCLQALCWSTLAQQSTPQQLISAIMAPNPSRTSKSSLFTSATASTPHAIGAYSFWYTCCAQDLQHSLWVKENLGYVDASDPANA